MPAMGYRAPDRKTIKLNIPVEETFAAKLQAKAVGMAVKRTELCRRILIDGLKAMEGQ